MLEKNVVERSVVKRQELLEKCVGEESCREVL